MRTVEYRISFYGSAIITDNDESEFSYRCGQSDVHTLFNMMLGKRIKQQYSEGVTIFKLGNKQVQIIKNYFHDQHASKNISS